MKKLTPIEVLIGIVLFASTVHVASQTSQKCWKKPDNTKIQDVKIMEDALNPLNWKVDCDTGHKCLHYLPPVPASKGTLTGQLEVSVECGIDCATTPALGRMGNSAYVCHECVGSAACKTVTTHVKQAYKECYDYRGTKNGGDFSYLKKIYCFTKCRSNDDSTKFTVGCEAQINAITTGSNTDCSGGDEDCKDNIVGYKCWKDAGAKPIDSVAEITDAFAREKWNVVCSAGKKCLQYYPEASNTKGKVQLVFECGDSCDVATNKMKKTGFTCTVCDTSIARHGCKVLGTDVKTDKPCCSYSGLKGKANDIKNIYCLDSCQYAEIDGGKTLTVGCADDIKSAGVTLINCPVDDSTCEKIIRVHQGSSNNNNNNNNPDNGATTTTASRRNSNKLTSSPTCLIVSMATLLFAASQYILN